MGHAWHTADWCVSELNELAANQPAIPKRVIVNDCTLREGEQQPGIVIAAEDKVELARRLDETGIPELEVGMPSVSDEERRTITRIGGMGLKARTVALSRSRADEIRMVAECGVFGVGLSLPVGRLQIKHKLRWPEQRVVDTAVEMTRVAHEAGLHVTLSPYDTTRADADFLERFLKTVNADGHIDRVRVVDTVGAATPAAIRALVTSMLTWIGKPIEIHCHNDFGLATANTLEAVAAGAEIVSTSFNGMGERGGGAPTEEVALALRILYGIDTGLDYSRFMEVSGFVEQISGAQLQGHKPVVGRNAFALEAGLIVDGYRNEPFTAMPYRPELVGNRADVVLGKGSGRSTVLCKLDELGLSVPQSALPSLLKEVKDLAQERNRPVHDEEFRNLVQAVSS